MRSELADLVGDLTGIPGIEDIALTTNGVLLAQHAVDLQANGLKRITVSLDTLDEVFSALERRLRTPSIKCSRASMRLSPPDSRR